MPFNIISKISRVAAGATVLALGITAETATYGQTQPSLPSQVIGTWTKTQTVPVQKGTATIVDTITIAASGRFQYSNSSTAPFQNNCTLTALSSLRGRASAKTASTLDITTTPGTLTLRSSCRPNPISRKTIPVLQGTLSWRRADNPIGEQLCLNGRLSSNTGKPFTIPLNNCYYRQ
ncbi:MAG: hypothetical protein ICV63_20535 [Coleofasciculus sp. Co-bin14]|nr:hypothetical protein [Coleofasciculus sp. Co-bin14]